MFNVSRSNFCAHFDEIFNDVSKNRDTQYSCGTIDDTIKRTLFSWKMLTKMYIVDFHMSLNAWLLPRSVGPHLTPLFSSVEINQ